MRPEFKPPILPKEKTKQNKWDKKQLVKARAF
jgi:hypothetical protein